MIQDEEFIDNLIAVDFNNRSEESKYKWNGGNKDEKNM
jgi:hypothetical protein